MVGRVMRHQGREGVLLFLLINLVYKKIEKKPTS